MSTPTNPPDLASANARIAELEKEVARLKAALRESYKDAQDDARSAYAAGRWNEREERDGFVF